MIIVSYNYQHIDMLLMLTEIVKLNQWKCFYSS